MPRLEDDLKNAKSVADGAFNDASMENFLVFEQIGRLSENFHYRCSDRVLRHWFTYRLNNRDYAIDSFLFSSGLIACFLFWISLFVLKLSKFFLDNCTFPKYPWESKLSLRIWQRYRNFSRLLGVRVTLFRSTISRDDILPEKRSSCHTNFHFFHWRDRLSARPGSAMLAGPTR